MLRRLISVLVLNFGFGRRTLSAMAMKNYPNTLEGFGYAFNEDGQLRQIDKETGKPGDKPFDFNVGKDQTENQRHYEALGEVITSHIYELLDKKGLHRIYLPSDAPKEEASFVFCTQPELKSPKKLMILIHGSGVVRAGQWARSLIINDSLKSGTQIPYIERAQSLGYEVLITNTNYNHFLKDGREQPIKGHENPHNHMRHVWDEIIEKANPEAIAIVAHSYGGVITVDLAKQRPRFFGERVFAVGFTDSVHFGGVSKLLPPIARNWVTSSKPLDELVREKSGDIPCRSAGHTKHEMTSYACMEALFKFVEQRYGEFKGDTTAAGGKKPRNDL